MNCVSGDSPYQPLPGRYTSRGSRVPDLITQPVHEPLKLWPQRMDICPCGRLIRVRARLPSVAWMGGHTSFSRVHLVAWPDRRRSRAASGLTEPALEPALWSAAAH